jgi:hypothetical protein
VGVAHVCFVQMTYIRHLQIRSALRFFANEWFKNQRLGAVTDPKVVMHDFLKYQSLLHVVDKKTTPAPLVTKEATNNRSPRGSS